MGETKSRGRVRVERKRRRPPGPARVVAVGARSVDALAEVLRGLGPARSLAVVLFPLEASAVDPFASLSALSPLPVTRIADGVVIEPGRAYVRAPGDGVSVRHGRFAVRNEAVGEPFDRFLASLASRVHGRAIGVVVSGTGTDGAQGLCAVRASGGFTFAEDPTTAREKEMPEAAVATGAVDFVGPLEFLATAIVACAEAPVRLQRALDDAEWSRDYAATVVDAVPIPFLVLDGHLRVVSTNAAFRERFAVEASALAGRPVYEIMGCFFDLPALAHALDRVKDEPFSKLEVERDVPGSGRRFLVFSGRAVYSPDGDVLVLLVIDDVTDLRDALTERDRLVEEAEAAKSRAEHANRVKDLFLATLSHELRTPLSSLLLQSQLLRRGQLDDERLRRMGNAIERATKAQARLIDDLLDISRIVLGKMKLEARDVGLRTVVQAAAETVMPTAEKKGLTIELNLEESLPPVWGDAIRLQQMVLNLLTNAIKFTPEGGRVTVSVERADALHGRIRVADSGIGIDPEFLPFIFHRFSQEEHRPGRTGLGLGLAIVRHLVEAHGGVIRAESPGKGQGATFTVELPFTAGQAEGAASRTVEVETHGAEPVLRDARILIVEDHPETRDALAETLRLQGARVEVAESVEGALQVFDAFRPDVIISDLVLGDEDGCTLLRQVRARGPQRGGDVPALALTALVSEADRKRAFSAGFTAHRNKPVELDRLVATLSTLLGRPTSMELDATPTMQ